MLSDSTIKNNNPKTIKKTKFEGVVIPIKSANINSGPGNIATINIVIAVSIHSIEYLSSRRFCMTNRIVTTKNIRHNKISNILNTSGILTPIFRKAI